MTSPENKRGGEEVFFMHTVLKRVNINTMKEKFICHFASKWGVEAMLRRTNLSLFTSCS